MPIGLRLAWRNLWRRPRRTWLTLAAIAFSNTLLVFMISLQVGMYDLMIENSLKVLTGHLQVQAPGYIDDHKMRQVVPEIENLARRVSDSTGLDTVSPVGSAFALISSENRTYGAQILGMSPVVAPTVSSLPGLVSAGRWLQSEDREQIVIGRVLARNLRVSVGDELTLLGSARDGSFAAAVVNVAGIIDSSMVDLDRSIGIVPFEFFDEVFFMRGAGHQLVVVAPTLAQVQEVAAKVKAALPPEGELVVHDWNALQPGLRQAIQADIGSAFFMYAILVVLVAFSVLNTQLMSVLERTREFGINLALGISPGRLGRVVMLETGLLGLLGLAGGAVLGGLLTSWFSLHGFSYPGMEEFSSMFNLPARFYPQVTPLSLFAGPVVVFLFTLVAALYPALRLHWVQPVPAMRAA